MTTGTAATATLWEVVLCPGRTAVAAALNFFAEDLDEIRAILAVAVAVWVPDGM